MISRIVAIPVLAAIWLGSPVPALAQDQEPRQAVSRPPETRVEKRDRERAPRGYPRPTPAAYYAPRFYAPVYYGPWNYSAYHYGPLRYVPWALIYGSVGYYPMYAALPYGPVPYGPLPYGPSFDIGGVRIKTQPREAEVFVDGYYAGRVDDFDSSWQELRLGQGPHKLEVRMPGFQTFAIDVHVQPGRTLTIHQDLHP